MTGRQGGMEWLYLQDARSLTSVGKNAQHSTFGPVLKWILKKKDRKVLDWIDRLQERGRRRVVLNTVMNLRVS